MVDFRKLISKTPEERQAEIDRYNQEIEKEEKEYQNLLIDAEKSGRLTAWEREFILNLAEQLRLDRKTRFRDLSNKQLAKLRDIEQIIYSVG